MGEPTIALPALRGVFLGLVTVLVAGLGSTLLVMSGTSAGRTDPAAVILRGVIELDSARADRLFRSACVYVAVRRPDEPTAPPLATRRLPAVFPLAFEVGIEDLTLGQPMPREFSIGARLDADGDPHTSGPDEPSASLDSVQASRAELRLVLR